MVAEMDEKKPLIEQLVSKVDNFWLSMLVRVAVLPSALAQRSSAVTIEQTTPRAELSPGLQHDLALLAQLNHDFVADREVIRRYNNNALAELVRLFIGEVTEFNGGDHEGYFSYPENYPDYCQQEISDIIIFGLQVFEFLMDRRLLQSEATIQSFESAILDEAYQLANERGILPVLDHTPMQQPTMADLSRWGDSFSQVRESMTAIANQINKQIATPEALYVSITSVLAHAYVLQWMLGLHPIKAGAEKVARNVLLYQAWQWNLSAAEQDHLQSLPEEEQVVFIAAEYKRRRDLAKQAFDSTLFYSGEPASADTQSNS